MKLNSGHKEALKLFTLCILVALAGYLVSSKSMTYVWCGIAIYCSFAIWTIRFLYLDIQSHKCPNCGIWLDTNGDCFYCIYQDQESEAAEKVENEDGSTTYRRLVIEVQDAKAAKDLSYIINNGFVDWNYQGNTDPHLVIGEPEGVYLTNDLLKADIRIYSDAFEKFGLSKENALKIIECSTPAVAGQVLSRNEDGSINEFKLTSISLCPNNVDPSIDKISVQMRYNDGRCKVCGAGLGPDENCVECSCR